MGWCCFYLNKNKYILLGGFDLWIVKEEKVKKREILSNMENNYNFTDKLFWKAIKYDKSLNIFQLKLHKFLQQTI